MVQCAKCDFTYEPATVPGGLCPRCLLLGMHESRVGSLADEEESDEPTTSLEDDELAAELPNFDFEEHLGRGGMGVVWKARERVLNRHVAIKLLRNAKNDRDFVDRFTREARIMAQLNHPQIVTLYSFGRTKSNHCYLVMEMVDGQSLADLIAKNELDVPKSLAIIQDVCAALRHAHDVGFMHRDIKPGNVLVDRRGHAKVADFGLARLASGADSDTTITRMGWAVGTPHYVAPEQANGRGTEDHRADIYSTGVVLYQMLTGELPRGVFRPPSLKSKVDKRLDKVVHRALQEEPEKRYQHIAQLSADVEKVRENVDPALLAERKAVRDASRWRQRLEMALAGAVSLLVGLIIAWYARAWLEAPSLLGGAKNSHRPAGGVTLRDPSYLPAGEGVAITREVRLQPPSLSTGSHFGSSVSASGSWLAVGAPDDTSQNAEDRGCVYLYHREADGTWLLQQCISNPHGGSSSRFGYDVSLDGARLVVAAPCDPRTQHHLGSVDLYELPAGGGLWQPAMHPHTPLMRTIATSAKVQVAGNRIVECDAHSASPEGNSPRSFAIFTQGSGENAGWKPDYTGPSRGFPFLTGCALVRSDELIACLSNPDDAGLLGERGAPLIDIRSEEDNWRAHTTALRPPSSETAAPPNFHSIAADADHIIAGNAKWNRLRGIAWILRRGPDGAWVHDALVSPPAEFGSCEFGKSVALHGEWAAIGADQHVVEDAHRGAVCLYHRAPGEGGTWENARTILADAKGGAEGFGYDVALAPQFIVVGAPKSGSPGTVDVVGEGTGSGAVFIYELAKALK